MMTEWGVQVGGVCVLGGGGGRERGGCRAKDRVWMLLVRAKVSITFK